MMISNKNSLHLLITGSAVGIVFSLMVSPSTETLAKQNFAPIIIENKFDEPEYQPQNNISESYRQVFLQFPELLQEKKATETQQPHRIEPQNLNINFTDGTDVEIKKGDTLEKILANQGVDKKEITEIIKTIKKAYNPRSLKAGQKIRITKHFDQQTSTSAFESIKIDASVGIRIAVTKNKKGDFELSETREAVSEQTFVKTGTVKKSFMASALSAGVPSVVAGQMIKIFSEAMDFRRDIKQGDTFKIMYSANETESGKIVGSSSLIFASIGSENRGISVFSFTDDDGFTDFYDENGKSLRKTIMKNPVKNARITSYFGMRRHPILGYRLMHWGVDYSSPVGTPIHAAGDGIITDRKYNGAYGKYMSIRHNSEFSTAYAHLHNYAKNINVGKRVKQGDVIGYVGNTGRSTGSHLHFEIIKSGKKINPLTIKAHAGRILEGRELKKFKTAQKSINTKYAAIQSQQKFASKAKDGKIAAK